MSTDTDLSPVEAVTKGRAPAANLSPGGLVRRLASPEAWLRLAMHGLAIGLVAAAIWLARVDFTRQPSINLPADLVAPTATEVVVVAALPDASATPPPELGSDMPTPDPGDVGRLADIHTIIPSRPRYEVTKYTVEANDTLFVIASKFNLDPETILWGNAALADNPNLLSVGQELNILPIDGALRIVQQGDTLEKIAQAYHGTVDGIVNFPGNDLDPSEPVIANGQFIIIPDGWREPVAWQLPVVSRTTGPSANTGEPGSCSGPFSGPTGSSTFVWPANNRYLSGTDFLPTGHPGLDIAAGMGAPLFASDSGVIVFAGLSYRGYGNLVIIDHGNGWQTAYAHLSQVNVNCGGSIFQGQVLGLSGSTGNSSGAHLHFEMRHSQFGRVNPWLYLP